MPASAALLALAVWLAIPSWEDVTVLPGVGVQLTTLGCLRWRRTRLLDAGRIRAVLINEARLLAVELVSVAAAATLLPVVTRCVRQAVTTSKAFFYLAFVVSGECRLVVAFPHTLPQLAVLQGVYQNAAAAFHL